MSDIAATVLYCASLPVLAALAAVMSLATTALANATAAVFGVERSGPLAAAVPPPPPPPPPVVSSFLHPPARQADTATAVRTVTQPRERAREGPRERPNMLRLLFP